MNKLDFSFKMNRQLDELKKCDQEIEKMFKQLDGIVISSSDSESESENSIEIPMHQHYHHIEDHFSDCCSCSDSKSDISYYEPPIRKKNKSKPQIKTHKSAKISYKLPYRSNPDLYTQSSFNLDDLIGVFSSNSQEQQIKPSESVVRSTTPSSRTKIKEKKNPKYEFSKIQPTWVPNGKFKMRTNSQQLIRSSSMSKLSFSSSKSVKPLNPVIKNQWKPNSAKLTYSTLFDPTPSNEMFKSVQITEKHEFLKRKPKIDFKNIEKKEEKPKKVYKLIPDVPKVQKIKETKKFTNDWKPNGNLKLSNKNLLDTKIFKPPLIETEKSAENKIEIKTSAKPPLNQWKPTLSKVKASHPNTWVPNPEQPKKPIQKVVNKKIRNSLATTKKSNQLKKDFENNFEASTPKESTPNITKDQAKLKLNESLIEKFKENNDNLSSNRNFKDLELENDNDFLSNEKIAEETIKAESETSKKDSLIKENKQDSKNDLNESIKIQSETSKKDSSIKDNKQDSSKLNDKIDPNDDDINNEDDEKEKSKNEDLEEDEDKQIWNNTNDDDDD
jgi:hypothetical protein